MSKDFQKTLSATPLNRKHNNDNSRDFLFPNTKQNTNPTNLANMAWLLPMFRLDFPQFLVNTKLPDQLLLTRRNGYIVTLFCRYSSNGQHKLLS